LNAQIRLFLVEGEKKWVPVAAMPRVDRLGVGKAAREAERAIKLFPYTGPCFPWACRRFTSADA
jgi:delta-aminolevulinic acid dehydratase/porphobilinogen synthase